MTVFDDGQHVYGALHDDVLVEWYRYPPGPAGSTAAHAHDEYHLCLSGDHPGEYRYRGGWHPVPPHSLSVIMPDEPHFCRDPLDRPRETVYTVLYARSSWMRWLAADLGGRRAGLPYFPDPVITDVALIRQMARLERAFGAPASRLGRDVELLSVLASLVTRHGQVRLTAPGDGPERAIRLVREYLSDNCATNVSLAELSQLADLSPYHLARLFRRQVGMPPHAYQVQVRLARAKRLLLRGLPVTDVAHETGFFDLSHFTRHFKRQVGTAPGRYSKNVHYGARWSS